MKGKINKVIVIVFLLSSCTYDPPRDNSLRIFNSEKDTIYVCERSDDSLSNFLVPSPVNSHLNWTDEIYPNHCQNLWQYGKPDEAWRTFVKNVCVDQKLRIWVFDQDTLRKYTWEQIVRNNKYKYKYLLSYDELDQQLGWTVVVKEKCK